MIYLPGFKVQFPHLRVMPEYSIHAPGVAREQPKSRLQSQAGREFLFPPILLVFLIAHVLDEGNVGFSVVALRILL